MPIFEYVCRGCSQQFELIVNSSTNVACPHCQSNDLKKQLSVFAVGAQDGRGSQASHSHDSIPAGCQGCGHPGGPGSCGMAD